MSSNSGTIINRSNEHSAFMNAIKSRNSKSLPELYSSEINTEPMAQSRVEIESSSSAGMSRTMRIALPRYGMLNKLYLHSTFGGAVYSTTSTTNGIKSVPFIGALFASEYRLMYNGSLLAKLNPHTIISDLWKHGTQREKVKLQELLGAFGNPSAVATADSHNSEDPTARWGSGGDLGGVCDYYLPLDFWFSAKHSPNRGLDLSVLANEVTLEIDVDSSANIFTVVGTATVPTLTNLSAVCYLTEMDMETEKQFRSLQYSPGTPLTQLAFDTSHIIVGPGLAHTGGTDSQFDIKLNQFSGQVFKLVVYATEKDNFTTNGFRIKPCQLKELQIKATGSNIVNMDQLNKKEDILESYHNGGDHYGISETDHPFEKMVCNPQHFYEINFKHPYDFSKVSATGSIAMGQLSVPSLRIVVVLDLVIRLIT